MVWAAAGVAITWLGLVRRQRWMRVIGGVLLTMAIALIVLLQLAGAPLTYVVMANGRVVAGVVVIALLYGLARLYRRYGEGGDATHQVYAALVLAANAVMLLPPRAKRPPTGGPRRAEREGIRHPAVVRARDDASITWALYATAHRRRDLVLRTSGIWRFPSSPSRSPCSRSIRRKLGEIIALSIIGPGVTP
jgi:hypothetical protein